MTMDAPAYDAWQDDDVGFVIAERKNDDAWISIDPDATVDLARWA